mmetsp:Transcript_75818/g.234699  ORF Transcript_75818/g.234699 Transcript_75818/m.234699 type:complete len:288 (-) Transcript_75818:690-1553(-)
MAGARRTPAMVGEAARPHRRPQERRTPRPKACSRAYFRRGRAPGIAFLRLARSLAAAAPARRTPRGSSRPAAPRATRVESAAGPRNRAAPTQVPASRGRSREEAASCGRLRGPARRAYHRRGAALASTGAALGSAPAVRRTAVRARARAPASNGVCLQLSSASWTARAERERCRRCLGPALAGGLRRNPRRRTAAGAAARSALLPSVRAGCTMRRSGLPRYSSAALRLHVASPSRPARWRAGASPSRAMTAAPTSASQRPRASRRPSPCNFRARESRTLTKTRTQTA